MNYFNKQSGGKMAYIICNNCHSFNNKNAVKCENCKAGLSGSRIIPRSSESVYKTTEDRFIWKDKDDEQLIELMRQTPLLWDARRSDYREYKKKEKVIIMLSRKFPGCTPMETEKRILHIKEKYRREKKKLEQSSRTGVVCKKIWHLTPNLDFLGDFINSRKRDSDDLKHKESNSASCSAPSYNESQNSNYNQSDNSIMESPLSIVDVRSCSPSPSSISNEGCFDSTRFCNEKVEAAQNNVTISAEENQKNKGLENHLRIFEYMAVETFSLPKDDRNNFVKKIMDIFWEYQLKTK